MSFRFIRPLWAVCGAAALLLGLAAPAAANQVSARIEGSLLIVRGDNLNNQIIVSQNAALDLTIRGQNGTKVNGRDSVVFRRAALQQADIRMAGGNDIVTFTNFAVSNDLYMNLGAGNDTVRSGSSGSSIGVNLTIEGGLGTDTVSLAGWETGQDLYVDGQGGVLQATLTDATVMGVLTVIGDTANDRVTLTRCTVGLDTSLELGLGADTVTVTDLLGFSFWATTDEGADRLTLTGVSVMEDFGIFTGTDNDFVSLTDVVSGKNVFVGTDTGADTVRAFGVSAEFDAVFEGGDGVDSLTDRGIFGGEKIEIKEFEIFP